MLRKCGSNAACDSHKDTTAGLRAGNMHSWASSPADVVRSRVFHPHLQELREHRTPNVRVVVCFVCLFCARVFEACCMLLGLCWWCCFVVAVVAVVVLLGALSVFVYVMCLFVLRVVVL